MVEEDRDAGSHRVGRLAFGVVYDGPQPIPVRVFLWGHLALRYVALCSQPAPEPVTEYRPENYRRTPITYHPPVPWFAVDYHRGMAIEAREYPQHKAIEAMRDKDRDAHPTLAGTGVYVKRNFGRLRKEGESSYQELAY